LERSDKEAKLCILLSNDIKVYLIIYKYIFAPRAGRC